MKFHKIYTAILVGLLISIMAPVTALVFFTSSTPQIITKGDTFSVSGTDAKNGTIAVWIIGRDYFDVLNETPDGQGNFSISLNPSITGNFSTGQYAVVFQDPGPSGTFEIEAGTDSFGNLTLLNRGKIIAKIGARQDLKGNVQQEVAILMRSAGIRGVDDTFLSEYFFVEEPFIGFDQLIPEPGLRLQDQTAGNPIAFSGTTNLGTGNSLHGDISDLNTNNVVRSKTIPIVAGIDKNHWLYETSEPYLPPGNYSLSIVWTTLHKTGSESAGFTVKNPVYPMGTNTSPVAEDTPHRLDLTTIIITGIVLVISLIIYAFWKK